MVLVYSCGGKALLLLLPLPQITQHTAKRLQKYSN